LKYLAYSNQAKQLDMRENGPGNSLDLGLGGVRKNGYGRGDLRRIVNTGDVKDGEMDIFGNKKAIGELPVKGVFE
jgi:hypothetical protein